MTACQGKVYAVGIIIIFYGLLLFIYEQIDSTLLKYLTALQAVMPKRCIQPRFEYGSSG